MNRLGIFFLLVLFCTTLSGEDFEPSIDRPDKDFDLKVDTTELKIWTGNVSYYFNNGYGDEYFGAQMKAFVESFDENKDGKFSNLEFRRFQTGAKKLFSDATAFLTQKFDENRNRRLDKQEKETVRTEIKNLLQFSLTLKEAEKSGGDGHAVFDKKRAIDDIYD